MMIIVRICTEYLQMIYQNQFVSNLVSTRGLKSEKGHLTVTLILQLLIFFQFQTHYAKPMGFHCGSQGRNIFKSFCHLFQLTYYVVILFSYTSGIFFLMQTIK